MKYLIMVLLLCMPVLAFAGLDAADVPSWVTKVLSWGTSIIGVASVVTSMTPSAKDNAVVNVLKVLLEALAFNFGHAKSKD